MLNLLPISEKKQLKKRYAMQLGIIVLFGFIATLLIGMVLLLPSFFLSKIKEQTSLDRVTLLEESSTLKEQATLRDILKEAQQKMNILNVEDDMVSTREVFDTILIHRSDGVEVTSIFYTEGGDVTKLSVNGVADTREDLLMFSEALEEDPLFSDIELPVSNLAKDRNISFQIALQGNF